MLFEALTGQLPFDRPTNVAKMFAHVNDPVPAVRSIAPAVPEWLDAIVTKAMAKRPEDRFASAKLLTRALGEALEDLNARERAIAAPTTHHQPSAEPAEAPAAPSEATTVPREAPPAEPARGETPTAPAHAAGAPVRRRPRPRGHRVSLQTPATPCGVSRPLPSNLPRLRRAYRRAHQPRASPRRPRSDDAGRPYGQRRSPCWW